MEKLRLAMLISGSGTTMEAIIKACQSERLDGIEPALVIASKEEAGGLAKAEALGIPSIVLKRKEHPDEESFGQVILHACHQKHIDLIGQYGWLVKTPRNVIQIYRNRIVNQHPGPLSPGQHDFGGPGMYGKRVHATRYLFASRTDNQWWTEATCHFVEDEYDTGQVIKRLTMDITRADMPETIAERLLKLEWECQIQALEDIMYDRVQIQTRKKQLVQPSEFELLRDCKKEAIKLYPHG